MMKATSGSPLVLRSLFFDVAARNVQFSGRAQPWSTRAKQNAWQRRSRITNLRNRRALASGNAIAKASAGEKAIRNPDATGSGWFDSSVSSFPAQFRALPFLREIPTRNDRVASRHRPSIDPWSKR